MTTKEMIAVMLAFDEGKTIEYNSKWGSSANDWYEVADPAWDWHANHYRVKKEPAEFSVLKYTTSAGEDIYLAPRPREENEKLAREYAASGIKAQVIKMREVLDES